MAAPFATVDDLKAHWSKLPDDKHDEATQKLLEASIEIRGLYPDVDWRLQAGRLSAETLTLVVCRMVKRALDVDEDGDIPAAGMESFQFGAGPFQFSGKPSNPDGNVYLSAADKRLLARPKSGQAFSVHPGGLR